MTSTQHSGPEPADRLQQVVERYRGPLQSFFRKRVYDSQEADDLVQELFCRLAARTDKVNINCPEAYIFQMAANLLRDRARRHLSRSTATRELGERARNSYEEISPERVLLGRQRLAELQQALAELPERTRAIFLLHRFEEYKYAEIAKRLGLSMSSVEKHMMEAIRHLSVRLGSE